MSSVGQRLDRYGRDMADPHDAKLPIRMLHDRVLVAADPEGERRSNAGIVIPATAQVGKRLSWAEVVGLGPSVRSVQIGDRVLFDPQERAEVELHGSAYVLLREREIHAVASERLDDGGTGLYL
jgi:chaperonin GroES